jgi:hypothetical protein
MGNVTEEDAQKPKQIRALQSLKSIYLTQRGTCNDLYLFASLKKNINQQMYTISKKYSSRAERALTRSQISKQTVTTSGKESDTSDSKNSMESKIRKTPYIKNMILQKILTTLPSTNKAESREEDSNRSNPSQCSSSSKNPIALSNSAMKALMKEPPASDRPVEKGKMRVTAIGPNGEVLRSLGKLKIVLHGH